VTSVSDRGRVVVDSANARAEEPSSTGSTEAAIRDQILDLIKDRGLQPGDRLPTEAEIAREFSVSRQRVRQGFLSLESQGIVQARQGSGRILLDRRFHTLPALLGSGIDRSAAEILDAVTVRQVLEVGFLPAAAEVIDRPALERMRAAIEEMTARAQKHEPFPEGDRAFHDALFSGLNNRLLESLLNKFWDLFEGIDQDVLRHREGADETIRHHQNILDALQRGDIAVAQFHMEMHFYDSVESLRDFVGS
jgi:DNA-binding FadR family transcriptional regulator